MDEQLSAALEYSFKKATKEVLQFNKIKDIEKIAVIEDDILYSKSRLLEAVEVKAVGHIADSIDIETFTGINAQKKLVEIEAEAEILGDLVSDKVKNTSGRHLSNKFTQIALYTCQIIKS